MKNRAAKAIRELGFELPDSHSDKYNRDSHQMPNAWKFVDGFKISVEVHHDAIERDAPGHLYYEDISSRQSVRWRDIEFETLGHEQMLHQLCRHLVGRHPGSRLKLINVADIVLYSEKYLEQIDWPRHQASFSPCHQYAEVPAPGSAAVRCITTKDWRGEMFNWRVLGEDHAKPEGSRIRGSAGDGQTQGAVPAFGLVAAHVLRGSTEKSLLSVKLWRHPMALVPFVGKRIISRILGG